MHVFGKPRLSGEEVSKKKKFLTSEFAALLERFFVLKIQVMKKIGGMVIVSFVVFSTKPMLRKSHEINQLLRKI